jgi:hypothetical protein
MDREEKNRLQVNNPLEEGRSIKNQNITGDKTYFHPLSGVGVQETIS